MTRLFAFVPALFLSATLIGPALAITETNFRYSQPRPGYLMLGPADFLPDDYNVNHSRPNGESLVTTSIGPICFHATVRLPHGAKVAHARLFYRKPAEANVIYLVMRRLNSNLADSQAITPYPPEQPPVALYGTAAYVTDPERNEVNNRAFRYDVQLCLSQYAELFNVRIDYTYTSAGD